MRQAARRPASPATPRGGPRRPDAPPPDARPVPRNRKPAARPDAYEDEPITRARPPARRRAGPAPDPLATTPHLTLPSIEAASPPVRPSARHPAVRPDRPDTSGHRTLLSGLRAQRALRDLPDDSWDHEEWNSQAWSDDPPYDDYDSPTPRQGRPRVSSGRLRSASAAGPMPAKWRSNPRAVALLDPPLRDDSVPDLVAYRPPRPRPRLNTRAIIQKASKRARSPWSITRLVLMVVAAAFALSGTYALAGEPSQPLMTFQTQAGGGDAHVDWPANSVTSRIQPFTQMRRSDLYDSIDQFNQWGGAACSAAALAEILTAYGVQGATIGRMIDELGADISPQWGLETYDGFAKVAAKHGYRADIRMEDQRMTYAQMKYITNTLGLPVIINVRIAYGYYRFFGGGHFLVVTAGDDQGLRIVDSSLYYVKYLPYDVVNSMFTWRTVVIVPKDYQYSLPS